MEMKIEPETCDLGLLELFNSKEVFGKISPTY